MSICCCFPLKYLGFELISLLFCRVACQWRREGGQRGACAPGGTVQRRHLEGRKYIILKFGLFWRIDVCIAARMPDSDILHSPNTPNTITLPVLGAYPQLSVLHDPAQINVYTKKVTLLI